MNRYISVFVIGMAAIAMTGQSLGEENASVQISNFAFSPEVIKVKAGTTINWINADNTAHTVTGNDGTWDSGRVKENGTYSHKFDKAGTFEYHCSYHSSMNGSVIVSP